MKRKKGQKFSTFRSGDLNPRFSVIFPPMIWIFMESEEVEIKSYKLLKEIGLYLPPQIFVLPTAMLSWCWTTGVNKTTNSHLLDIDINILGQIVQKVYVTWGNFLGLGFKVHIFWEGHKILRNLHLTFVLCSTSQK